MGRHCSIAAAAAMAWVIAAADAAAQEPIPLTNYGPEAGFFTPQATKDLERGIVQAQRSLTGQAPAQLVAQPPQAPMAQAAAAAVPPVVPLQPVVVQVQPAQPTPFVRIPDPTQLSAAPMNTNPLAAMAEASAAQTASAEAQMDQVERENERARRNPAPAPITGAFDGLTGERNR
jgi:hypothetical protein